MSCRRYLLLFASVTTLAACGGGDAATPAAPPSTTPPPPPPPPPPPAPPPAVTLAIAAGAQQAGEPLTAAAVRPSVVARAADGSPVAAVTVTFAVDSGGGTVTGATATTGTDGVATVGGWTLGPNEGRHVLVASSGTLAPARFVATASVQPRPVAERDLTAGTLEVTSGPLSGVKLEVPEAAFDTPALWTIEQRSVTEWPTRKGIHPVGASLVIKRSDGGIARKPLRLTLPARLPAGTRPVVVVRDPASGAIDVLPLVDADSSSVTAAAFHFDPTFLATTPSAALARPRASHASLAVSSGYNLQVVVSAVPVEELDKDQVSNYLPGRDDWDFVPEPQAVEDPQVSRMPAGLVLSSMARLARASAPPLHGRFREIASVQLANRVGFRAGAYVGAFDNSNIFYTISALRSATRAALADQLAYDWLKAALYLTGRPVLASAAVGANEWVPLVAWRAVGNQVSLANPWTPGNASFDVPFANGRFGAFSVANGISASGAPTVVPAQWLSMVPLQQVYNVSSIDAKLQQWEAGQYPGDPSGTRQARLDSSVVIKAHGGFVEDTILYVSHDTTRYWVECRACQKPLLASPLAAKGIAPFLAYAGTGSSLVNIGSLSSMGKLLQQTTPQDERVGFLLLESDGNESRWLDFRWMRLKRWILDPRPPISWELGAAADWVMTVNGPTLPAHRYRWTFGSGATPLIRTSATTTLNVTVTASQVVNDSIPLRVEILRTPDDSVLSLKEVKVPAPKRSLWRLTSFSMTNNTSWPAALGDVPGAPSAWVIFAYPSVVAGTGFWPTPGAYLQRNPATANPVLWLNGVRTIPLAHTVNNPGASIEGSMTWTGDAVSGALTGQATHVNTAPCANLVLFSVTATKTSQGISGTLVGYNRSWTSGNCSGPAINSLAFSAAFTAVLVP